MWISAFYDSEYIRNIDSYACPAVEKQQKNYIYLKSFVL